ncbi:MAG: transporter ATP-binding protein [Firmicutes bacterium]|nr:transporter ATP-binding protein [Bacillota bacterium]
MLKLLRYLREEAAICAIIAPLMMIVEVSMDLIQPKLMADIIDIGIANQDVSYVILIGGEMILAAFIGLIGGIGNSIFCSIAAMKMGGKLRQGLFDKIQTLTFLEIDKLTPSSLITRLTNDISQVQNMVLMVLRGAFRSPLICLGGIIMAIALCPELAMVFLVAIPVIIIALIIILKKSFPLFTVLQGKMDRINAVMRESILGVRVIKAFTLEERHIEKFGKENCDLMNKGVEAQNMSMILWPIVTLVMNMSVIAVIWIGGNMANDGTLAIGKVMAFVNYLIQIMSSFIMVVMLGLNFSRSKVSADRINEVLQTVPSIQDNDSSVGMRCFDVEFKNVSFKYNEHSENVLTDISLKIKEGEKVGIIGGTGSGKSSLVNLIPRLYDATEGQVFIGGIDVKKLKLKELRENIGLILQESIIFSGTIEDNLKFGDQNANRVAIDCAVRDAQAFEFIMEKEHMYQSVVEQRGKNFSGGQKQRISIARTLIRNPKILIMDDSFSALDMATEAKLQSALKARIANCTVVMIAQRISVVMDADKIIVLDNGKISAIGTHKELLRDSELYRKIAVFQLGEEVLLLG